MTRCHRHSGLTSLAALALTAAATVVFAQSPALDPAFGERGRSWIGESYESGGPSSAAAEVVPTPDGGALVLASKQLFRVDRRGVVDTGFGYRAGGVAGGGMSRHSLAEVGRPHVMANGSQMIPVLAAHDGVPWATRVSVLKLRSDGARDTSYGIDGFAASTPGQYPWGSNHGIAGIAVEPDGRAVVASSYGRGIVLNRFLPDGRADESFGPDGRREIDYPAASSRFVQATDGSFALPYTLHGQSNAWGHFLLRFAPGGELDPTYGSGQYLQLNFGLHGFAGHFPAVELADDGSAVVAFVHQPSSPGVLRYMRVEKRDPGGASAPGFGNRGVVDLYDDVMPWDADMPLHSAAAAEAGVLAGGTLRNGSMRLLRLDGSGELDARRLDHGVALIRDDEGGAVMLGVAPARDGAVFVAAAVRIGDPVGWVEDTGTWWGEGWWIWRWRTALYRVRAEFSQAVPPGEVVVVEYFNVLSGHYFLTPLAVEQAALDAGGEWRRTGHAFRAWVPGTSGAGDVCRFWSGTSFGAKSTHFYTHVESECASLRDGGPWWSYEGTTFAVRTPEGVGANRGCPAATIPLYRAYNNGQSGAPNHRYTTSATLLDQMVAAGWVAEGEAGTRIFACVAGT